MEKAYVYVRNWDLLQYDAEVLLKYNLEKASYWYIGSTKETLAEREAKFKYQMLNQEKSDSKNSKRYVKNKTSIFIKNLVKFYKNELKLSENDIDKLVFNYYETLELDLNYIDECKLFEHQLLEAKVIEQYMLISSIDKRHKVLSIKDGYMKIEQYDTKTLAMAKENRPIKFSSTLEWKFDSLGTMKSFDVPTELEKIHGYLKRYIQQELQIDDIIEQK